MLDAMASLPTPTDFLVVDYLQLLNAPKGIAERRLQVEALSKGLKAIATERRIPVLCLSSLARPHEGRDKEPTLASLRESGELEHDADVVLLLHREQGGDVTACPDAGGLIQAVQARDVQRVVGHAEHCDEGRRDEYDGDAVGGALAGAYARSSDKEGPVAQPLGGLAPRAARIE